MTIRGQGRLRSKNLLSEHTLKFLRIVVDVQQTLLQSSAEQRYAVLKLRLVKSDHVPQSAMFSSNFSSPEVRWAE